MKNLKLKPKFHLLPLLVSIIWLLMPTAALKAQMGYYGYYHKHVTTTTNTMYNMSVVDNATLNESSYSFILMTHCMDVGLYNNFMTGLRWNSVWQVINEDSNGTIPENSVYHMLRVYYHGSLFVHTSNSSEISYNTTTIDYTPFNGQPGATLFITHDYTPFSKYHNVPMGVFYNGSLNKWCIFNEDNSAFPENLSVNVFAAESGPNVFVHTAVPSNIYANSTKLDHPELNNNPNAILIITQYFGHTNIYNSSPVGVFYEAPSSSWFIYNENGTTMPDGAMFNVLVANPSGTGTQDQKSGQVVFSPNPVKDYIKFGSSAWGTLIMKLFDMNGQLVREEKISNGSADLRDLQEGMYIIQLNDRFYKLIKTASN